MLVERLLVAPVFWYAVVMALLMSIFAALEPSDVSKAFTFANNGLANAAAEKGFAPDENHAL